MRKYYQICENMGFYKKHRVVIICADFFDKKGYWDDNPKKDEDTHNALEKLSFDFTGDAECMYAFDENPDVVRHELNGLGWQEKDIGAGDFT